jgi:hypothetical protein
MQIQDAFLHIFRTSLSCKDFFPFFKDLQMAFLPHELFSEKERHFFVLSPPPWSPRYSEEVIHYFRHSSVFAKSLLQIFS